MSGEWRVAKIGLYFVIPAFLGYSLGLALAEETTFSSESLYWFFGASIQAFSALLGLIALVITFRIQHIRGELRDIQSAVLDYSRLVLEWAFAGFDMDEIKTRKDKLFEQRIERWKQFPDEERKKENLEALPAERIRFDQLLDSYEDLDNERKELYDKAICPMTLLVGTVILSFGGLAFVEAFHTHGFPAFLPFVAIAVWAIIVIGRFLVSMTLREKKIRVHVSVEVKERT